MSINDKHSGLLIASPLLWLVALLLCAAAYMYAFTIDLSRAWQCVLINYVYFTPLAAAVAVWPAIVILSRGNWLKGVEHIAFKTLAFIPASFALLAVLWFGRQYWGNWSVAKTEHPLWLDSAFVFARFTVALAVFWFLALRIAKRWHKPGRAGAAMEIVVYCIAFSFMAFDFIMALDPKWVSSLFGGYFFISGFYAGITAWTFLYILRGGREKAKLQDFANMIIAFSLLTTYMMFSQLIVLWYENLPHDVRYVIPRLTLDPWKKVSALLLCMIYLGPLVLLLTHWARTSRVFLGCVCVYVLCGLWIERWWLIVPTIAFERFSLGWIEAVSAGTFVSLFGLSIACAKYLRLGGPNGQE